MSRDATDAAAAALPGRSASPLVADLSAPTPAASTQTPAAATAAPATTSPGPTVAAPAEHNAPVLVSTAHGLDGAQRLTVRLDPPELGHVQIRIDRPAEAPARVEITVERAETLTLLLRDQPQLQRALDAAGVPAEGRVVTFHVASPEPSPRSDPTHVPSPGVAAGGPNHDGSHGAHRQGGQPGRHQQAGTLDTEDTQFTPIALPGWLRGGLNITA